MSKIIDACLTLVAAVFVIASALAMVWADLVAHGTAPFTNMCIWVMIASLCVGTLAIFGDVNKDKKGDNK